LIDAQGMLVGMHEGTHGENRGNAAFKFKESWFGLGEKWLVPEGKVTAETGKN